MSVSKMEKPSYEDLVEIIENYDRLRIGLVSALDKRYQICMGSVETSSDKEKLAELEGFISTQISNFWLHSNEDPFHSWEQYQYEQGKVDYKLPDLGPDFKPPF